MEWKRIEWREGGRGEVRNDVEWSRMKWSGEEWTGIE